MRNLCVLLASLLLSVPVIAQTTVTIPAQTVKVTIPVQVFSVPAQTVSVAIPAQTVTIPATVTPPPVVPPPPVTPPVPPPAGSFVIYNNGVFRLPGDDSWCMTSVNYNDKSLLPVGGTADIAVTLACPNGGWQPIFVQNGSTTFFNLSGYRYLELSIRPPTNNASYYIGFAGNLDTADGVQIQIAGPGFTKYGPPPMAGIWAHYKIPLADFKMTNNTAVFKFGLADGTGLPAGTVWGVDNVSLTP